MSTTRIKLARLAAAYTLRDLSGFLSDRGVRLSHAALHKYETGQSTPSARTLLLIAEALRVRPAYLLQQQPIEVEWLAFRKKSRLTKGAAEQVKAAALPRVEHQIQLQRLLGSSVRNPFPRPRPVRSPEDAEQLADSVRRTWKLGEAPLPSVTQAIEDHGGVVVEVPPPSPAFDGLAGLVDRCLPIILVNDSSPADRKRYNLAHELGHLVMACDGVPAKQQESLAHRFAAAFLVPAAVALRELGARRRHLGFDELVNLKSKHGLSVQAWIRRAKDLGVVSDSTYATLCREVSRRGWRKQEPGTFEGDERPVRFRQMVLRALAEGAVTPIKAEEMLPGVTGKASAPSASRSRLRELLAMSLEERSRALRQEAESMVADYAPGGALRTFDMYEKDLDDRDRST